MRHAIVVFTKVPEAGKVKTRLTKECGGMLTPEEAKLFYEASLFDMLEICTAVDNVDIWICHNADGDRAYLNTMIMQLSRPQNIAGVFKDLGGTYEENMRYAADFLLKPGEKNKLALGVLIVGGDACGLEIQTLKDAMSKLEGLGSISNIKKAFVQMDSYQSDMGAVGTIAFLKENLHTDVKPFEDWNRTGIFH
jgi:glycosyltransferase A (GT-A) superfamily protein (DUF2064 family)